ncbi:hypothetical protein F5X99DRAFT_429001 [Biscogniauxia marginata]|nr:hypothetical protein F5X99DRAFT_429001 [Biscogniauxia marginata]
MSSPTCGKSHPNQQIRAMAEAALTTPLVQRAQPECHSTLPSLLFGLLFALCLSGSFVSFIPPNVFDDALPRELSLLLQSGIPTDYVLEILWPRIQTVLDYAVYLSVAAELNLYRKRQIRKSDSLYTIIRGCIKIAETATTTVIVLMRAGYPLWISAFLASEGVGLMGYMACSIALPIALKVQERRSVRNDSVESGSTEAENEQSSYTSGKKTEGSIHLARKLCCCVIICIALCLLFGGEKDSAYLVCYVKLGNQVRALDATFDKMVQSFSKASSIFSLMGGPDGVLSHITAACERVWEVGAMELGEVRGIASVSAVFERVACVDEDTSRMTS